MQSNAVLISSAREDSITVRLSFITYTSQQSWTCQLVSLCSTDDASVCLYIGSHDNLVQRTRKHHDALRCSNQGIHRSTISHFRCVGHMNRLTNRSYIWARRTVSVRVSIPKPEPIDINHSTPREGEHKTIWVVRMFCKCMCGEVSDRAWYNVW